MKEHLTRPFAVQTSAQSFAVDDLKSTSFVCPQLSTAGMLLLGADVKSAADFQSTIPL